jgi:hypothetical protein
MNTELGQEEVTITLTRFEWNVLLRGARLLRNKTVKQINKNPTFVPEPGKIDVNRNCILQYNSAITKIERQWGSSLDYLKD